MCVTVHAIKSSKEAVDAAMQQVNMGKNHHAKHVSLSNSSAVDRGGGLRLNKFLKTRLKHESLDNVGALE